MKRTMDTTTATDEALTAAAMRGDEAAFSELHRRHAPLAWRLALAVTGDPELAGRAVGDGTGAVFTAIRAGRSQAGSHGTALAAATRNAALDLRRGGASTSPVVADDGDALLATAFAALPERWRSVLWLRDAEGLAADHVAPVVELTAEATDQLAVRARRGLRERYLKAQVGTAGPRDCTRAVARLGALEEGTLGAADAANLESHLSSCPACAERRDRVAGLAAALPGLALPVPSDLRDRAGKAWTAALASSTRTGLSPRTEKILAGASAFAAALGILGATVLGGGGDDEPTASPLAPLVADIETPRPVDLSDLIAPLATPEVTGSRGSISAIDADARRTRLASNGTVVASPSLGTTTPTAGGTAPGATPTAPAVSPGTPAAEAPTSPLPLPLPLPDVPIGIDSQDGVTVGPINVDTTPGDDPAIAIDAPAPLAPVVDPVLGLVDRVASPVLGVTEPLTTPLLDTLAPVTTPLTGAVNGVLDRLGL